jgi:peptide/nickel transport system substrate-binding protein
VKRPQPAILALIASGYTLIFPCHVPPRDLRQHPIGTGPFKFVEFKPNESIRLARNPDYWKPRRPYLDGIEYTIIPNRSTAILAFTAGKFDLTFPYEVTVPLMKDVQEAGTARSFASWCLPTPAPTCWSTARHRLLTTRTAPRARLGARPQELYRHPRRGTGRHRRGDAAAAGRRLGNTARDWRPSPAIVPTFAKNRTEAREIMARLGYGPEKRLAIKLAARNIPAYRDPAIILIDQLKQIGIDGELDPIETVNWFPKLARKDYQIGLNNTGSGVDDPDQQFFENYGCGSERNCTGYCNAELEKRFVEQSEIVDRDKRRHLVWDIDKQLQEDGARPIIYHTRAATCMQQEVKGLTVMVNSQYNGWRMENVWLDRETLLPQSLRDGKLPLASLQNCHNRRKAAARFDRQQRG